MFRFALGLHNILRWVVVIAAVWTLVRAYLGWLTNRPWTRRDSAAGRVLTIGFDVQFLVGIFLAVMSPLIQAAIQAPEHIGTSESIRFFAVEHVPVMVAAWIVVHITSVIAKRAEADHERHQRTAIGYTLAAIMLLLATPWWRPLFPGL
jgi:hypothetical protein